MLKKAIDKAIDKVKNIVRNKWKEVTHQCWSHPIYILYTALILWGVCCVHGQWFVACLWTSLAVAAFPLLRLLLSLIVGCAAKLVTKIKKSEPPSEETPPKRRTIRGNSPAWLWTIHLIMAAFLLQYAVNGCGHLLLSSMEIDPVPMPAMGVQTFDALFSAFRSVGITEEYNLLIAALDVAWTTFYGGVGFWGNLYVAYLSVLYVAIPLAGSAFILGVFAKAIPSIRLWCDAHTHKEHCYFSGLNPQSLALAESLLEEADRDGIARPMIVFTDAYVDDESEQSMELLLEAKRLGAICVRDDLAHVYKREFCKHKYFLMEENEYENLPALMNLVEEQNVPYIKGAIIYMFVQTDVYVRLEENIRCRLRDKSRGKKALTEDELPAIIPVNAHRNLVNNLMEKVPLYEPLVGCDTNRLTITILGNGSIGTEAFLSAYWFARMLVCRKDEQNEEVIEECRVTIHVVSQDDPKTFWGKIESVNADILNTIRVDDPLLAWRPNEYNAPYCTVHYHKADVKTGVARDDVDSQDSEKQTEQTEQTEQTKPSAPPVWLDTNYVIVALGDDASNIAVANNLRARIGKSHLEKKDHSRNTVIAYVVYNSELCTELNVNSRAEYGVYMYAFGDLKSVYSGENVFMTQNKLLADEAYKAYYGHSAGEPGVDGAFKKPSRNYSEMADMARALHIKYKLFSLGWITTSLFNNDEKTHRGAVKEVNAQYKRVAKVGRMMLTPKQLYEASECPELGEEQKMWLASVLSPEDQERWWDLCKKRHYLAWLEHRRWCAYTRTMGYRFTDAMEKYYLEHISHKNDTLKLHPCLVEARWPSEETATTYVYTDEAFWQNCGEQEDLWEERPNADALDIMHILRFRAQTAAWKEILKDPLVVSGQMTDAQAKHYERVTRLRKNLESPDHCKYYDYFVGEFPEYVIATAFHEKMKEHLKISLDAWNRQCKQWEARGAFSRENGATETWVVPMDCVKSYIETDYPLFIAVKEYKRGHELSEGVVPAPFAFEFGGCFYAADTPENRKQFAEVKAGCKSAADQKLLEAQAAMMAQLH